MRKAVIKGVTFGITFFLALIIISFVLNRGNNDLTVEMSEATYPLVSMQYEDEVYNVMHGYKNQMNESFQRSQISVLGEGREVKAQIQTFQQEITGVSYEVRSADGNRLIENGDITEYENIDNIIQINFFLKDLIEENTEYNLTFLLTMESEEPIRYYTRFIWAPDYHFKEKIDYVNYFHETTFNRENASELTKYLESNSSGDNTTLQTVNIHSSLRQVTWGELVVQKETEPSIQVTDIASQTGNFVVSYIVSTSEGREKTFYQVEEFYRIRYTTERIYLLEYTRSMNAFLDEEFDNFTDNKLDLGIGTADISLVESEDGNIFVFQNQGRLLSYNINDNEMTVLFSFYDTENYDIRTIYQGHKMKVLNVDEAGNANFMVYGYMSRGRHEGDVGVQLYFYNSTTNTVEESVYIPYTQSEQVLIEEIERLAYLNWDNIFYIMLDGSLYAIDLENKNYEVVVKDASENSVRVSESNKMVVWQNGDSQYSCESIILMDLSTNRKIEMNAGRGEYILPLGFMGEDLIYGLTRQSDVAMDSNSKVIFPMYKICIQNAEGDILKTYSEPNVYTVDYSINNNQISLTRVEKTEAGSYQEISDDHIMSNEVVAQGKNVLSTVTNDIYQKVNQIVLKNTVDQKNLKILTPKEVLFEGGRSVQISMESEWDRFYVFSKGKVEGIFMNSANAFLLADELAGIVLNDEGECIWRRGNRVTRNQIMAIKGAASSETQSSVAVCLNTILEFEGITRNTQMLLSSGTTPYRILEENLPDYQILDLTGSSLEATLFFVNKDIPVFALLSNGDAVLVVGFNELEIVLMDPTTGTLYKRRITEASRWFEENGNVFISYAK